MASLQDFYIKLEGIDGESKDSKHTNWIDVLSFEYAVTQSSSMATGGGGGVGRANFDALSFVHYVDRATPALLKYCAKGKHIPEVTISACKAGDGSQEYMSVRLFQVLVTHAGPVGTTEDARVKEKVDLSYSEIRVEVKEQNADGTMGATVTGGWKVKENIEV